MDERRNHMSLPRTRRHRVIAGGSPASELTPDELAEIERARAARLPSASTTPADRQRMLEQYPVLKAAAEAWAKR